MSIQTPNRDTYDDKGQVEPLVGGDPPNPNVPTGNPADPRGDVAAGNPADPRGDTSAISRAGLGEKERSAGSDSPRFGGESEAQSLTDRLQGMEAGARSKSGLFRPEKSGGKIDDLKKRFGKFTRKKMAVILVTGVIGGGGIFGFGVLQGPLEFLHFAKMLEKFHLKSSQDFSDSRSSRILLYTLAGAGERGRLGITANVAADRWEKKIVNELGIRPVFYDNATRHHAGWEIVDIDKANSSGILDQLQRDTPGADRTRAGDIKGLQVRGKAGARLDPNTRLLYYDPQKVSAKSKRQAGKTVRSLRPENQVTA